MYKKFNVKRQLWTHNRTVNSRRRKVRFEVNLEFQLLI